MPADPSALFSTAFSTLLSLAMERHREKYAAVRMMQADVAAALTGDFPAGALERLDELLAGDDREAGTHAGIETRRRTTPASSGRPTSRRSSMYKSSASRAFSIASSNVSPSECSPGRSGA